MPKATRGRTATGGDGGGKGKGEDKGKAAIKAPTPATSPGGGRGAARAGRPASAPAPTPRASPSKARAIAKATPAAAPSPAKKPPAARGGGAAATTAPLPSLPPRPPKSPAAWSPSLFALAVSGANRAKRELAALGGEAVDLALGLAAPRSRRAPGAAGPPGAGGAPRPPPAAPPLWGGGGPPAGLAPPPFPSPSPKGHRSPRSPLLAVGKSGGGRRGRAAAATATAAPPNGFVASPLRLSVQMGAAAAAAAVAAATAGVAAAERAGLVVHGRGGGGGRPTTTTSAAAALLADLIRAATVARDMGAQPPGRALTMRQVLRSGVLAGQGVEVAVTGGGGASTSSAANPPPPPPATSGVLTLDGLVRCRCAACARGRAPLLSVAAFEAHAVAAGGGGGGAGRGGHGGSPPAPPPPSLPGDATLLSAAGRVSLTAFTARVAAAGRVDGMHAAVCAVCGEGGRGGGRRAGSAGGGAAAPAPGQPALALCAGCPTAAHPACVGLDLAGPPPAAWYCGPCLAAGRAPTGSTAAPTSPGGGGGPVGTPGGRPVRAAAARVHMAAPAPDAEAGGASAAAALRAARRERASSKHGRLFMAGVPGGLGHGQPLTYRTVPAGGGGGGAGGGGGQVVLLTGSAIVPPAGAPPTALAGILCGHCGRVVSCATFEAHAGGGGGAGGGQPASPGAPYDNTFTADGVSLRALAAALPSPAPEEGLGHYPPGAELSGPAARAAAPGGVHPNPPPQPAPDLIPGGCVLCHRADFQLAGFGPRTIIICDQCEREFHVDCLAASGRARLGGLPVGDWFCSPECHGVSGALRRVVAAGERSLPGAHALHILRGQDGTRPTEWALRTATDILAEAFDPILDVGTGQDLTRAMVTATQLGDWDYTGMFTALLRHRGAPVCAAVFRVFGPQLAELPLIATRSTARRQGHARVLVRALERLLAQLGVAGLCLPAAHETVGHWKAGFGFSLLAPDALRAARSELRLLVFPGTEVLAKKLAPARGPPHLVPPAGCGTRTRAAVPGGGGGGGGVAAAVAFPASPPAMVGGSSYATAGTLAHLQGRTPAEAAAAEALAAKARGGPPSTAPTPTRSAPPPTRGRAATTGGKAAAALKRRGPSLPPRPPKAKVVARGGGSNSNSRPASGRPVSPQPRPGRASVAATPVAIAARTRARSAH